MLVELLQKINDNSQLPSRVDEIIQHGNTRAFKEISTEIVKLGNVNDSIGYELAQAIFNVEVGQIGIVDAYQTLQAYQDNEQFHNAVIKLRNVLDNDENIKIISENLGITRQEIQDFFKSIAL